MPEIVLLFTWWKRSGWRVIFNRQAFDWKNLASGLNCNETHRWKKCVNWKENYIKKTKLVWLHSMSVTWLVYEIWSRHICVLNCHMDSYFRLSLVIIKNEILRLCFPIMSFDLNFFCLNWCFHLYSWNLWHVSGFICGSLTADIMSLAIICRTEFKCLWMTENSKRINYEVKRYCIFYRSFSLYDYGFECLSSFYVSPFL